MVSNNVESAIKKVKSKGKDIIAYGWMLVVFNGLFVFIICTSSNFDLFRNVTKLLFLLAFTALGIWLIIMGNKKYKLIKTFHDYSARFSADPELSMESLASATGVTVERATKNVKAMLVFGFFPNCYFDKQYNKLVIPTISQPQASSVPNAKTQIKYITVQCKSCGATNKIVSGTVGECEFCGSQISE